MNETYKKIEELAHYVSQHSEDHDHMPTVIIASRDMQDERAPLYAPRRDAESISSKC